MKIEAGKRYITREGKITAPLLLREDNKLYPFFDDAQGFSYTANGHWRTSGNESEEDIIAEYHEPPDNPTPPPEGKAATDKVNTGLAMIPPHPLFALGEVFVEGLRYGKDNWKKGVNDFEYQEERYEHAFRHLLLWKSGDRSENHLAKVMWFCTTQLELERMEKNGE